ncbi:MAG: transposase [Porphyrobacter sp.]|nr:transposase [Porphyrobacter sp.]
MLCKRSHGRGRGIDRAIHAGTKQGGPPRKTNLQEVWNAILYITAAGCQRAILPRDFPPFTTVQHYFYRLRDSGVLAVINETLVMAARALCPGARPNRRRASSTARA